MAYAAYTDVEARVGTRSFTASQQTRCGTILTQESNYINGYLGHLYSTPFASPYPNMVAEACILLAAGDWLLSEMVDQPQVEAVERRAESFRLRGQEILDKLLANPGLLAGTGVTTLSSEEERIAPQMRVSSSPASITLQDSSTWRRPTPSPGFISRGEPEEYP